VCRPERLLPVVEEKIEPHRGAYGCVAWIVCVLAVPWEVMVGCKVFGDWPDWNARIKGLKFASSSTQSG
jgi:hypothetical protein